MCCLAQTAAGQIRSRYYDVQAVNVTCMYATHSYSKENDIPLVFYFQSIFKLHTRKWGRGRAACISQTIVKIIFVIYVWSRDTSTRICIFQCWLTCCLIILQIIMYGHRLAISCHATCSTNMVVERFRIIRTAKNRRALEVNNRQQDVRKKW